MTLDKEQESNDMAGKVLALDTSIMSVGVISDSGIPLGGAIRRDLQGKLSQDKRQWVSRAFRVAAIMGAVRTEDAELSSIKSIELIREESKSLLIRIPKSRVILAVVFDKAKAGSELSDNIRRIYGLK